MVEDTNSKSPVEEKQEERKEANFTSNNSKKNKLQKLPNKYIKIAIIIASIILTIIIGLFLYKAYTFNKIPRVYKNVIKTYSGAPKSIKYINTEPLKFENENFYKSFLFENEEIEEYKIGNTGGRNLQNLITYNKAGYLLYKNIKDPELIQEEISENEESFLEQGINFKGEIKGDTVIQRFGYYEGNVSPYENDMFNKLNSMVTDNTVFASYNNGGTAVTEYGESYGNYDAKIIPKQLEDNEIKALYIIIDTKTNGKEGDLKILLETYSPLKSDLYMNLMLNNIKKMVRENRPLEIIESKINYTEKEATIEIKFKGLDAISKILVP